MTATLGDCDDTTLALSFFVWPSKVGSLMGFVGRVKMAAAVEGCLVVLVLLSAVFSVFRWLC